MFDILDYTRAATRLVLPIPRIMAISVVESSGETSWALNGRLVVPVRFEAHWFGKLTDYRYNASHPDLSSTQWNPALAANTREGAWDQVNRACQLDQNAAFGASSWGGFQVMGFNWSKLDYTSVQEFVDSMSNNGDDGQMDAFVKFVEADTLLHKAMINGDYYTIEQRYNGGGYNGVYAAKIEAAERVYERTMTSPATVPITPRALRKGDHGADVVAVQGALGVTPDGDFGPLTNIAVRSFQTAHNLVSDGIVGVMTRRALGL